MYRKSLLAVSLLSLPVTVLAHEHESQASIAGQVIAAESGEPIVGASVRLGRLTFSPFGFYFDPANAVPVSSTGPDGAFQFNGLAAGSDYAVLVASTLRVRSLSGVQACAPSAPTASVATCSVSTFEGAFPLGPDENLQLPPIELQPAARLSGFVRSATNQQPVAGAQIQSGEILAPWLAAVTGQDGSFAIDHLPLGVHRPLIWSTGHVSTGFDGHACGWYNDCDRPSPLLLDQAIEYSFEIDVDPAASIQPELSYAGSPVPATSRLFSEQLPERPSLQGTNFSGLPPGTYTLLANPVGFVPQYFDGLPCPDEDCSGVVPTPIVVEAGQTVHVSMSMVPTRWITGRVLDANTGEAIPGVTVQAGRLSMGIFDWLFHTQAQTSTGADGSFTLVGLWEGALDLVTHNDQGYIDVRHPAVTCQPHHSCHPGNGYPAGHFQIAADTQISGVDITLMPGGRISGSTNLFNHPLAATVRVRHAVHEQFQIHVQGSNGGYQTGPGLIPGSYQVIANYGMQAQLYDGVSCETQWTCPLDLATLVVVEDAADVDGIDFQFSLEGERIFQDGFEALEP